MRTSAIAGRSVTVTTSTLPFRSRLTSVKKPVLNSVRMISG
jgi:hypothetical protein